MNIKLFSSTTTCFKGNYLNFLPEKYCDKYSHIISKIIYIERSKISRANYETKDMYKMKYYFA